MSTAIGYKSDWTQLETLDIAVIEAYLERRCDPLVGTIEPTMYLGSYSWKGDVLLVHASLYAQKILDSLINVHAEVNIHFIKNITFTVILIIVSMDKTYLTAFRFDGCLQL